MPSRSAPSTLPPSLRREADGLTQLRAIMAGEVALPSMAATLGFRLVAVSAGMAEFEGFPDKTMMNPLGVVHGGWASSILDSALGCAVHSTLAPGETYGTVELKVNLTRPIQPGSGPYRARGSIITRGRRIGTAEARLSGADGKIFAFGTTTCLIETVEPR